MSIAVSIAWAPKAPQVTTDHCRAAGGGARGQGLSVEAEPAAEAAGAAEGAAAAKVAKAAEAAGAEAAGAAGALG